MPARPLLGIVERSFSVACNSSLDWDKVLKPRILFVVNAEWYFWSHRLSLAKALMAKGCEVTVAATVERNLRTAIESEGIQFIPLRLQRRSLALHQQAFGAWEVFQIYRKMHPDLVHHITIKPVIYGSLAAKVAKVPAILNTIPGLGYMFLGSGMAGVVRMQLAAFLYRIALAGDRSRIIFQNPDDRALFVDQGIVPSRRTAIIRGSGVNLDQFTPAAEPPGMPIVLLASRLLWDKGVKELVQAGKLLREEGILCRIVLVGAPDSGNPNSVPESQLQAWQAARDIEWWGPRTDMPHVLHQASIVALPSYYREGVPRILIEAAASGRPMVASDAPGCREIVRHGENGLLVPVRDAKSIAEALALLIKNPDQRVCMGRRGRDIAAAEFSEEKVIGQTLALYRQLLGAKWPH